MNRHLYNLSDVVVIKVEMDITTKVNTKNNLSMLRSIILMTSNMKAAAMVQSRKKIEMYIISK